MYIPIGEVTKKSKLSLDEKSMRRQNHDSRCELQFGVDDRPIAPVDEFGKIATVDVIRTKRFNVDDIMTSSMSHSAQSCVVKVSPRTSEKTVPQTKMSTHVCSSHTCKNFPG
jgi:hypothetical protein